MCAPPRTFHDRTLWPESQALAAELNAHLRELTERVTREAINYDPSESPLKARHRQRVRGTS
jgi:hypothetical protein